MTPLPSSSAVLVEAVRTPVGKYGGALAPVRPDDLAAHVLSALVKKTRVAPEDIEEVILGCANQAGEDNRNVARMAALLAGLGERVAGLTVNRLCASGLDAINLAARAIVCGEGEVFLAGGVESMSRAPWVMPKASEGFSYGNLTAYDSALGWRFPNPRMQMLFPLESMGETAENIFEKFKISRERQDGFALESHRKAWAATQDGRFHQEIAPVTGAGGRVIEQDETIRPDTTLEKLRALAPAFRKGGAVTAGNSSPLSDGASAVLVMNAEKAKRLGMKPVLRWVGSAATGVSPRLMGLGPVEAVQKLLRRTGVALSQVDLFEINEAFAVQALACVQELDLDLRKINVCGGALALGHPLGCSGARLVTTLLYEMRRRDVRYGVVSLCVGVGQGVATLFEKI
ncbi:MAG: thiolase family protein [Elusimicrobia bacterium]|nr:thiolase family protein [Elusimicrobiota bacterium]